MPKILNDTNYLNNNYNENDSKISDQNQNKNNT